MTLFMSSVTVALYVEAEDESEADFKMMGEWASNQPFGFDIEIMENTDWQIADDEEEQN